MHGFSLVRIRLYLRRKISAHVFVSFQDFVGKNKELFCLKPGQIRQRRGIILNTGILDL